jgi:pyocin large subunit-like protein
MEKRRIFAAVSAVMLGASLLMGCTDHNESYIESRRSEPVTTAVEIQDWTIKTQTTTAAATTTKKAKVTKTTAKKNKSQKKATTTEAAAETTTTAVSDLDDGTYVEYRFRSKKLLNEHFEKHGSEFKGDFDYSSAADYEKGASDVINNKEALHKTEAEDGDGVYYIEDTNEFVILSKDGYIRTYFRPNGGKSYYDRQ